MKPKKAVIEPTFAEKHQHILTSLFNQVKAYYSFGKIKTLKDALLQLGHTDGELEYAYNLEQLNSTITFSQLKRLEEATKLRAANEDINYIYSNEAIAHTYDGYSYNPNPESDGVRPPIQSEKIPRTQSENGVLSTSSRDNKNSNDSAGKQHNTKDEVILSSLKQKAILYKFQAIAVQKILYKIIEEKRRCLLLRAGTGTGKTFILAAMIRQMLDNKFPDTYNCLAPWPFVWITRKSVVEQTKRVARDKFGIDLSTELLVVGIEQMRSKFGELFLSEETVIHRGEESIIWKWREPHHPLVFIIDESHLAKNENSCQSKIIQSLSEVKKPIFIICSSATPFCRVSEAKYMAVNTHMEL